MHDVKETRPQVPCTHSPTHSINLSIHDASAIHHAMASTPALPLAAPLSYCMPRLVPTVLPPPLLSFLTSCSSSTLSAQKEKHKKHKKEKKSDKHKRCHDDSSD